MKLFAKLALGAAVLSSVACSALGNNHAISCDKKSNCSIPAGSFETAAKGATRTFVDTVNGLMNGTIAKLEPSQILVVYDNDNTLTTMPAGHELGGVAWWDWQSELQAKCPNPSLQCNDLVAPNFDDLLYVQKFLFRLRNMIPTETNFPATMAKWNTFGLHQMVLTARGEDMAQITQEQLTNAGYINGNGELLFADSAPGASYPNGANLAGTFKCSNMGENARSIGYRNGVMYLAGQDKGLALACLVGDHGKFPAAQKGIQAIVFVDDNDHDAETTWNSTKVYLQVKNNPGEFSSVKYVYTFDYQHDDSQWPLSDAQKDSLNHAWLTIKSVETTVFPITNVIPK